jgi:hypothetical protein
VNSPITELCDQLDQLRAAATPGPWWNESGTVHAPLPFGRNDGLPGAACHPLNAQGSNGLDADADAELAAAAVNALPQLTAALRAVEALADRLDDDADSMDQVASSWDDVGHRETSGDRCRAKADQYRTDAERLRTALATVAGQ